MSDEKTIFEKKFFHYGREGVHYDPKGLDVFLYSEYLKSETGQHGVLLYPDDAIYLENGHLVENEVVEKIKADALKEYGDEGWYVKFKFEGYSDTSARVSFWKDALEKIHR